MRDSDEKYKGDNKLIRDLCNEYAENIGDKVQEMHSKAGNRGRVSKSGSLRQGNCLYEVHPRPAVTELTGLRCERP